MTPLGLLIPDGGQACDDIRWYCKDAKSCTERWTTAGPRAGAQPVPGTAVAGTGEAAFDAAEATPDAETAEQLSAMLEEATSVG